MNKTNLMYNEPFPIPPGETVKEYVEFFSMTMEDFAQRLGCTKQTLARIYRGEQPITEETAVKLELVTGVEANFWANLEAQYQFALISQKRKAQAEQNFKWISQFPIAELQKRNFFPKNFKKLDADEREKIFLKFFQIGSIEAFKERINNPSFAARTTYGLDNNIFALETWIQIGVVLAKNQIYKSSLNVFNREKLIIALDLIRKQSSELNTKEKTTKQFLLDIRAILAEAGVHIIYLEKLNGINKLNGVVRWLDKHPIIILSLTGKKIDKILFSLFHEAGHILLDNKRLHYVSCGEKTKNEINADNFAAKRLLPFEYNNELCGKKINKEKIKQIATKEGIYEGIVVGRQCYLNKNWKCSYLQKSISWNEINHWYF